MPFKFIPEMADRTGYGPCCCVTQRANGITFDLFRYINQQIHITQFTMAMFQTMQYFLHPSSTLTTWRTLSAAFVMIKTGKVPGISYDTLIFIISNKTT